MTTPWLEGIEKAISKALQVWINTPGSESKRFIMGPWDLYAKPIYLTLAQHSFVWEKLSSHLDFISTNRVAISIFRRSSHAMLRHNMPAVPNQRPSDRRSRFHSHLRLQQQGHSWWTISRHYSLPPVTMSWYHFYSIVAVNDSLFMVVCGNCHYLTLPLRLVHSSDWSCGPSIQHHPNLPRWTVPHGGSRNPKRTQ